MNVHTHVVLTVLVSILRRLNMSHILVNMSHILVNMSHILVNLE